MLTVLVIDESRSRAGEICAGLALAGYQVAAILAGSKNLTAEVEKLQPDVILIDTDSPSHLSGPIKRRTSLAGRSSCPT